MARYFSITGPVADFEMPADNVEVTGMFISQFFPASVVLVLTQARIVNNSGLSLAVFFEARMDGNELIQRNPNITILNGAVATAHNTYIIRITQGTHRFAIHTFGNAAAGDIIRAESARLSIVELPAWSDPLLVDAPP